MDLIDKILSLKELGYSKEEIDSMLKGVRNFEEKEVATEKVDTEKEEEVEKPIVEEVNTSETNDRLKNIEDTLKAIQANNVKWSSMPVEEDKTELDIVQEILGGLSQDGNE